MRADGLDPAQLDGLGDLDAASYRRALHEVADVIADYAESLPDRSVLPPVEPGSIAPLFPAEPPEDPQPLDAILDDYRRLVEPNATAWNHPGFMAYFPTSSSGAGVLGELLMASLAQNTFLWRTSPIGTELETVVVSWLRQALGLPDGFDGVVNDTASIGSLMAIAAAREAAGLDASQRGLPARPEVGEPRVYASAEAHSSIDKACMILGLGRDALVHIPTDDELRLRPDALETAITEDLAAGRRPIAIVATLGTTASTSADPIARIAEIAERHGVWLHVDAAYAGVVALLPELRGTFAGWERADSIVVNPHKWLFTPFDASLFLGRRMDQVRAAFSVVPEYLRTLDRVTPTRDMGEYTPQLGRRFRALKLWIVLRWFGLSGLRRRIAHHLDQAQRLASWVDDDPDFERLAPVPFSVVSLRWRPAELLTEAELATGAESADAAASPEIATFLDAQNQALMDAVNRTGKVLLSHARLHGRFAIRVAFGNLSTTDREVELVWDLLRDKAASLARAPRKKAPSPVGAGEA
jgi:aromatic-L-amino-acid/L-tryptophan decarboxylase